MATVKNNRENQFDFHHKGEQIVIPAGKRTEKGFEPSETEIDDDILEEASKQPVVAAWFAAGDLTGSSAKPVEKKTGK